MLFFPASDTSAAYIAFLAQSPLAFLCLLETWYLVASRTIDFIFLCHEEIQAKRRQGEEQEGEDEEDENDDEVETKEGEGKEKYGGGA